MAVAMPQEAFHFAHGFDAQHVRIGPVQRGAMFWLAIWDQHTDDLLTVQKGP